MKHIYKYPPRIISIYVAETSGVMDHPIKQLEELLAIGYKIVRVTGEHDGSKNHLYFLEHPDPMPDLKPPKFDDLFKELYELKLRYLYN